MLFRKKTSKIKNAPYSISELRDIPLGGVRQWILLRGRDVRKPVLLILHGGPGMSLISISSEFFMELEKHFVVVNWDQRGSGLSYNPRVDAKSMNIYQFVSDVKELSKYLIKRFNQDKIYLLGHSWGSLIGTLAVQSAPELFHAYVGAGQVVNMAENETIAYEELLSHAKKENLTRVLEKLTEVGPPPYKDPHNILALRIGLTMANKEAFHGDVSMRKHILQAAIASKEYSMFDLARYMKASFFSIKNLWWQATSINLEERASVLEIPVFYILGRNDQIVLPELSVRYYENLKAPYKELIWFEHSGHSMMYEEPALFQKTIIEKLSPCRFLDKA